MHAGRAKLTDAERATIDAQIDGTPDSLERAFREQVRLARQKIAATRRARREKGRPR